MRVRHLSTADSFGGAARAAYRLHRALSHHSHPSFSSTLQVVRKSTDDWSVEGPASKLSKGWPYLKTVVGASLQALQVTSNPIFHSSSFLPCRVDRSLNRCGDDLLHLHWVQEEFLSIEAIGRLRKPLVWTLHDTWAFCGSEHYPNGMSDRRFEQGYWRSNRPLHHNGLDLDRWCWHRKLKSWTKPFHIVCPSEWLASCVQRSALMSSWPVSVIPNALPTQTYQPYPSALARQLFGLPADVPLIFFGAIKGLSDSIKGWSLLKPALQTIASYDPDAQLVVFGQSPPKIPLDLSLPIHYVSCLRDDQSLAILFSAASVVVVPSKMEAFGQVAAEAQACGVPVVAFKTTGLIDVVEHECTGYLAEPYSSDDLAYGVRWVLSDQIRWQFLSRQARRRSLSLWREDVVAQKYFDLYQSLLAGNA